MANFKDCTVYGILALSLATLCFTLYYATSVDHMRKVYIRKDTEYTTNYNFFESSFLQRGSPQYDKNIMEDVILGNSVRKSEAKQNVSLAPKYAKKSFAMTRVKKDTKMGYILVTLYAEQQIGAAMNMFSLQKWAKTVNACVVEPFVIDSQFKLLSGYPIKDLNNKLRFRDYFNIQIWNELSVANNATPLTSWSDFLNRKPKTFIFVAIINAYKNVINPVHINDDIMNQFACKDTFDWFTHKLKDYKDLLQAKMVRRVCLSFFDTRMNISDFTQYIYGDIDPTDTIVWFQIWKGFSYNNRVRVVQQYFHRTREILPMVCSSDRIITDAQNYVRRYLGTEFGEYVGISIRSVVRAKYLTPPGEENMFTFFKDCFKNLGETILSLNTTNKKVFMSLDLGRFGDKTQTLFISPPMITSIEDMLFQTLYNGSVKMQEWESSFIDSTNGITDSGYIAAVQRTILDNSKCLIMFGGRSNFQRNIELKFKDKYGNDSCIRDVCYTQ